MDKAGDVVVLAPLRSGYEALHEDKAPGRTDHKRHNQKQTKTYADVAISYPGARVLADAPASTRWYR